MMMMMMMTNDDLDRGRWLGSAPLFLVGSPHAGQTEVVIANEAVESVFSVVDDFGRFPQRAISAVAGEVGAPIRPLPQPILAFGASRERERGSQGG